jgi:hypothetical protein
MSLRPTLLAAALALSGMAAAGHAGAAEPVDTLLDRLAPKKAPEGSVEVVSWIERSGQEAELVVRLVPKGQVKLVADPGITVTPVPRVGIAWTPAAPISQVDSSRDYFLSPPTLRVPFRGEDGRPVEAAVEYAYCLVDYQCLFGEARVSAPTRPPQG